MKDKEMIEEVEIFEKGVRAMLDSDKVYVLNNELELLIQSLGYRKLPENSVVLNLGQYQKLKKKANAFDRQRKDGVVISKEEYNKVDNIFKMSISDHIAYLRENKRLKEDVQALIGARFNRFNLITQEESDKQIQQARKETAEKFYKKVEKLLKKVDIIVDGDEGLVGYEESAVDKGLTELAKQFGVEIKD